ncbi:MAG TPA: lactate utilization protein [Blastocatellia bacterium]|nr:lactate utilization protein [Blastocatellia bacterium]
MPDTNARETILENIRRALHRDSSVAVSTPALSSDLLASSSLERSSNGEQPRSETIQRFSDELTRIGGRFQRCAGEDAAFDYIEQIAISRNAKLVLSWDVPLFTEIDLRSQLANKGITFEKATPDMDLISKAAEADIGISGVDYALADTGTLVLFAARPQPRSISLLPPVHLAILKPHQILPGLNELFPLLGYEQSGQRKLSSAITFITGPSRTADIELKLVVGVHGPQELHVLLLD